LNGFEQAKIFIILNDLRKMDKKIYGFIFYCVVFVLFESWSPLFAVPDSPNRLQLDEEYLTKSPFQESVYNPLLNWNTNFYDIPAGTFIPKFGDLVINEVMADPTPVVKLPDAEFVELKNNSGSPIELANWLIEVNGRAKVIPKFFVGIDSLLILSGTGGTINFSHFGPTIEISGLQLPNDGFTLKLISSEKILIDSFVYKPQMQREGYSFGGYSLERIDANRLCGAESNWETTISLDGGTPGAENSVKSPNPDVTPPAVISVDVAIPDLLEVVISEMPDYQSISGACFSYLPTLNTPDSIRFNRVSKKYSIYFPKGSMRSGIDYELIVNGLSDECGNRSEPVHRAFWYYLPVAGDVLINEVLFNPYSGGVDFVELYNHSGRKLNLNSLFLAALDDSLVIKSLYPLSIEGAVFPDDQYGAFTSDPAALVSNYRTTCHACIYGMTKMPAYNLDQGWVVVVNSEMTVIDQFHYLEQMHNPLLSDLHGISLERGSFLKASADPTNWHSASETVGFATPGYLNSASVLVGVTGPMVELSPRIFSPNDDGYNDRLVIKLSPGEPGWIANIRIYNESGVEIRRLSNNLMIGSQEVIEWDGTKENNQKAGLGIYLVKIDLFELKRGLNEYNEVCVLTDRL